MKSMNLHLSFKSIFVILVAGFSVAVNAQYSAPTKEFALEGCETMVAPLEGSEKQRELDTCRCIVDLTDYESIGSALQLGALDLQKVAEDSKAAQEVCEAKFAKSKPKLDES